MNKYILYILILWFGGISSLKAQYGLTEITEDQKIITEYDEEGNLTWKEVLVYDEESNQWVGTELNTYLYSNKGQLLETEEFDWNPDKHTWGKSIKNRYAYDSFDNCILEEKGYFYPSPTNNERVWLGISKKERIYEDKDKLTLSIQYDWDYNPITRKDGWMPVHKTECTWSEYGYEEIDYKWYKKEGEEMRWIPVSKEYLRRKEEPLYENIYITSRWDDILKEWTLNTSYKEFYQNDSTYITEKFGIHSDQEEPEGLEYTISFLYPDCYKKIFHEWDIEKKEWYPSFRTTYRMPDTLSFEKDGLKGSTFESGMIELYDPSSQTWVKEVKIQIESEWIWQDEKYIKEHIYSTRSVWSAESQNWIDQVPVRRKAKEVDDILPVELDNLLWYYLNKEN